ncbi:MAG TPA: hypothetical protein ENG87_05455 [Candidatus Pacearchaeota archaeon]|nr:hypothetical protein BMS3Abin17_01211 [archaeon BMS3Abin17]HDK42803.1 hypothetical protein [Candidatus Pacearchaeota archaeon]HDZ60429.1 hypothetical protein [Candidatus Pacearchaeota archaeon]
MNFIKKIVDKSIDENVHFQFQKFSKGEFRNRAVIKAKNSKGKYTITTTAEFANEMVRTIAEKLGDDQAKVTGAIISTNDLKDKLDFKEIKQFQGVKKYLIDKEMTGKEILDLLDEFPKAFFALSFEIGDTKLKIKPKSPKSGKPVSKGGEAPKPNFCRLITNDKEVGGSFVFEKPEFKDAEINHIFIIDEIVIPEEFKEEKDFAKVREAALRKGRIIRTAKIDGQETIKEIEFVA